MSLNSNCVCGATKYIFRLYQKDWIYVNTNIKILSPLMPCKKGGMRVCFNVEEIEEDGTRIDCIAKFFLKKVSNVVKEDYFNEGEAQCMCEEFAKNFNNAEFVGMTRPKVSFLQCNVVYIPEKNIPEKYRVATHGFFSYKTTDTNELMFFIEPKLSGHYTKYNNNFGESYNEDTSFINLDEIQQRKNMFSLAEAFSHFTLLESKGSMLVCDLQGVNDFFTDPQIHTEDGRGLGMGNMGWEGIKKFVKSHKCNNICRALKMTPLLLGGSQNKKVKEEKNMKEKNEKIKKKNKQKIEIDVGKNKEENEENEEEEEDSFFYNSLLAQLTGDLTPLPKPIEEMTEEERVEYAIKLSHKCR